MSIKFKNLLYANFLVITIWILCANACNVSITVEDWSKLQMDIWLDEWIKQHPECSTNNSIGNEWYICFAKNGKSSGE